MTRRELLARLAAFAALLGFGRAVLQAQPAARPVADVTGSRAAATPRPLHHSSAGGFINPWPTAQREPGGFWRWQRERRGQARAPNPPPGALPLTLSEIAHPRAAAEELRVTWVGHATFLIQAGGLNLLTDPIWSRRASPVQWAGPSRLAPPGVPFERLPPLDAVLLSHDHYDHLDEGTVRQLQRTFGERLHWFVPLEFRRWFAARGVRRLAELDWWEEAKLAGTAGALRIVALPAQHWTSRTPWDRQQKLWASWAIVTPGGRKVYFAGDSGWFPGFPETGERAGPFDVSLLPIGAYEPRWFMRPVHMNPEEAVRTYQELGGEGVMGGMHWGTFRLTDEDPLEPPVRTREAWAEFGFPAERLWIPRHGETRAIPQRGT